jgi:hypothetical protein
VQRKDSAGWIEAFILHLRTVGARSVGASWRTVGA